VWIDVWIPASSSLHRDDVRVQLEVVGEIWRSSLEDLGSSALSLAEPRPARDVAEEICCFLGRGAGEVLVASAKLVGLAAWRSREGALVQSSLSRYRTDALIDHLDATRIDPSVRTRLVDEVADLSQIGLAECPASALAAALGGRLGAAVISLAPEVRS
jgi:hypothetical protein